LAIDNGRVTFPEVTGKEASAVGIVINLQVQTRDGSIAQNNVALPWIASEANDAGGFAGLVRDHPLGLEAARFNPFKV
jgi:hypothetical protein